MRQVGSPTLAIGRRINPYEYRCRAEKYPPLKAEEAVALCLFCVGVVGFAGCGVETVAGGRYPYLVHSEHPFFCGPGLGVLPHPRGHFLSMPIFYHFATISQPYRCFFSTAIGGDEMRAGR